ncbi:MAG: MerR family transcriptional regulator [Acidobacteriaceae bacterium]
MAKATAAKKKAQPIEVTVPDKLYFRIGEVAELLQLEAYVLRFWETEFPQLKPTKSSTGQRLYRQRDVELALHIQRLLYQDGYTIAGARQFMKEESSKARRQPMLFSGAAGKGKSKAAELKKIKQELESVRDLLKRR